MKRFVLVAPVVAVAAVAAFLATVDRGGAKAAEPVARPVVRDDASEVRLGYFPNVTHATAIVGVSRGMFASELGKGVKLTTATFNAGPAAVEALFSGAIDLTYIGPNPAINAFVKSHGKAVRVIAGATSGGAFLVVDPSIQGAADLKGRKVASPQLGNTQDVALRAWLQSQKLHVSLTGASDVTILPQENAQTLEAFKQHQIAGAWVPEPWASRLILEGGGKVLVDERDLWPDRAYVTTHLLVRADFLADHPETVKKLLRAHVEAGEWLRAHGDEAKTIVNDQIAKITGKKLDEKLLAASWSNLAFTNDPIAGSLKKSAQDAEAAGLLQLGGIDLSKIYALELLNGVLKERGLSEIKP